MNDEEVIRRLEDIHQEISRLEPELERILKEKKKKVDTAPQGSLKAVHSGRRVMFYHRDSKPGAKEIYIQKKEEELIQALAQKGYDRHVVSYLEEELKQVKHFAEKSIKPMPELLDLYESAGNIKQEYILPIVMSDEEYIQRWKSVDYKPMHYPDEAVMYETNHGELVRSKSELIIANELDAFGVPYRYEYPLDEHGTVFARPDFTVLNVRERKDYYWEHFGMMGNGEYLKRTLRKISDYEQKGIFQGRKIIYTFESTTNPLNILEIRQVIQEYLL